jgi:hypothetical protein
MKSRVVAFLVGIGFLLVFTEMMLSAHHSFAAVFDKNKPVKLTGTVTKVEWLNPHVWFYVDVKDGGQQVTNWAFELTNPNMLMRSGWTKTSLKPGDAITVEGFAAKDGRSVANTSSVILVSTGEKLFSGEAGQTSQP